MTGQEKSDLLIQVTALAGLTVYDNPYDTIKIIYKNGYNMNTTGRSDYIILTLICQELYRK
jgi:hypothetical protein